MAFLMTKFSFAIIILTTLFLLSGCGQKGPLYMPTPEKTTPTTSKTQE